MPNFHSIFFKNGDNRCFASAIDPTDTDKDHLFNARDKIRRALRTEILRLGKARFGTDYSDIPRFYTQGSWSYRTCNRPCQSTQEMDLDLGVYLPIDCWEDNDITPKRAAGEYFDMVSESLQPLVEREGWSFDDSKDTCVRVRLTGVQAHIDVPLYVAPRKDFLLIKEAFQKSRASVVLDAADFAEFSEQEWSDLGRVSLAMRNRTWKDSDPRKVAEWFEIEVTTHSEQLRRICRYLKAFRDHYWTSGGPSSILLMICAAQVFKKYPDRDDLALLQVLERMGTLFVRTITCPQISDDEDFNRMGLEARDEAHSWADHLAVQLRDVIYNSPMYDIPAAIKKLQTHLDPRFTVATSLVTADTPQRIREYDAVVVAQPTHRVSRAG